MNTLKIPYPAEVLWALQKGPEEFEAEARLLLALKHARQLGGETGAPCSSWDSMVSPLSGKNRKSWRAIWRMPGKPVSSDRFQAQMKSPVGATA